MWDVSLADVRLKKVGELLPTYMPSADPAVELTSAFFPAAIDPIKGRTTIHKEAYGST